jgi:flagellar biogenesis protein FliO
MAWLQEMLGNSGNMGLQLTIIFLALVAALVLLVWLFRKRFGGGPTRFSKGRQPRLSVTDAAVVDDKRRLVLVRRDNVEHLVMIGGPSDIVVETNIVRAAPVAAPAHPAPQNVDTPAQPQATPKVEPVPAPASGKPVSQVETAPAAQATAAGRSAEPARMSETANHTAERMSAGTAAAGVAAGAAAAGIAASSMHASETNAGNAGGSRESTADAVSPAVETVSATSTEVRASLAEFASASTEPATTQTDDGADLGGSLAESLHDALGLEIGETEAVTTEEVSSSAPAVSVSSESADDEMRRLLDELSAER